MTLERLAGATDIPPGEGRCFTVSGQEVAVFNVDGTFRAIHNTCPHRGGPLGDGALAGTTVTCPWHGWQFDCVTGQSTMNPAVKVNTYTVRVEGDGLYLELP
jgi:nitrite reductase/ring-hydroxylating ferredoxin subunit